MKKIDENKKVTLTVGQIKKLISEEKYKAKFEPEWEFMLKGSDDAPVEKTLSVGIVMDDAHSEEEICNAVSEALKGIGIKISSEPEISEEEIDY